MGLTAGVTGQQRMLTPPLKVDVTGQEGVVILSRPHSFVVFLSESF
jgi:hypothetical protein